MENNNNKTKQDTHYTEDGVAISAVLNGIINDIVLFSDLLLESFSHIHEALLGATHVNIAEALIEENFSSVELELETQLLVVDCRVPTEIEESIIKVFEGKIVTGEKEIRHASLEITARDVYADMSRE